MTESSASPDPAAGNGRAIFTVDLEEYFQVGSLREWIPRGEWESLPSRAGWALDRCLEGLDVHDARATFFASGWLLENHPELAVRVVEEGHEAAVLARPPFDGDERRRREEFRRVARQGRERLARVTGRRVLGYRTSGFTHPIPTRAAAEILAEEGYAYDSTLIDPTIVHTTFGVEPEGRAVELPLDGDGLLEAPPTVCSFGRKRLFTVGGTAFRVLPQSLIHALLARDAVSARGGVFYMRSWEFDPQQPILPVPLMSRVRLYWGLDRVPDRLEDLLERFPFDSVAGALGLDAGEPGSRESEPRTPGPGPSSRGESSRPGRRDGDAGSRPYRRHG